MSKKRKDPVGNLYHVFLHSSNQEVREYYFFGYSREQITEQFHKYPMFYGMNSADEIARINIYSVLMTIFRCNDGEPL